MIGTKNTSALLCQWSGGTEPLPTKVHYISDKNKVENFAQAPDPIVKNQKKVLQIHVEVKKHHIKHQEHFSKFENLICTQRNHQVLAFVVISLITPLFTVEIGNIPSTCK